MSAHGIYLNWRNNLHQTPVAFIGGFEKAAVAVRFNPRFVKLPESDSPYVPLPYALVFAVATQNTVYVFDTCRQHPIYIYSNLHYASLTDIAWSADGYSLVISSVDGFCTAVSFNSDDFAFIENQKEVMDALTAPIKASTFHNPPPKPAKVLKVLDPNETVVMSSEIDIEMKEPEPVNPEPALVVNVLQVKKRIAPTLLSQQ